MNPLQKLNARPGLLDLGDGNRAEILSWNYAAHLRDNVAHRHTFFEICLVGNWGAGEFLTFDSRFDLKPNVTFFARPGAIHQIQNTQTPLMELFWVSFGLEIGGGALGELLRAFESASVAVAHDAKIAAIWRALWSVSSAENAVGDEIQLDALISALITAIAQSGAGENTPTPIFSPQNPRDRRAIEARLALQYVHDNLGQKLTLAEIANHLHVSARHLSRLFADFAGTSPASYIEHARLDKAQRLLLKSDKPLKEIAREVGFEDVSHFNRVFSRGLGTPPGEFRKCGGPRIKKSSGPNIQKIGDLV